MVEAVFIDRDGTIGGTGHFIHPDDFKPYPFSQRAILLLKETGIKVFAFTNQHRIARGQASIEDFQTEFSNFGFDDAYICPHRPEDLCECHKPKPGMLLEAARKHRLDLTNCVVIGDVGATDMLAASEVGATKILVKTGWGMDSLQNYRQPWAHITPDHISENLEEAVHWIINKKSTRS